jgi:lipoate-protein ligase A
VKKNIKEKRFPGGNLQLFFDLNDGLINNLKIYGDFLDTGNLRLITENLEGIPYHEIECEKQLNKLEFKTIFNGISQNEFLKCLFD